MTPTTLTSTCAACSRSIGRRRLRWRLLDGRTVCSGCLDRHDLYDLVVRRGGEEVGTSAPADDQLLDRQRAAYAALADGRCSGACAGSTNRWGVCSCPCQGRHHAALWSTELVPEEVAR